jgi:hypothetical protein
MKSNKPLYAMGALSVNLLIVDGFRVWVDLTKNFFFSILY